MLRNNGVSDNLVNLSSYLPKCIICEMWLNNHIIDRLSNELISIDDSPLYKYILNLYDIDIESYLNYISKMNLL